MSHRESAHEDREDHLRTTLVAQNFFHGVQSFLAVGSRIEEANLVMS